MSMAVALTILKFICLILICVLALVVFVLLCLLFVPFGYKVTAEKYESLCGCAAVSWLFGIIKVVYEFEGAAGRPSVKVFGITVWREKDGGTAQSPKKSVPNETDIQPDAAEKNKTAEVPDSVGRSQAEAHTASDMSPQFASSSAGEPPPKQEADSASESRNAKKVKEDKKNKKDGKSKKTKRGKIGVGADELKKLWEYKNKREILKQTFLLLKRLIKIVTSFKLKANLKIGTGQPDTTGGIIGLCWAFAGAADADINAEADFENTTLLGTIAVKGRIFICSIIWAILLFILNKNIFPIVKRIIFKKG